MSILYFFPGPTHSEAILLSQEQNVIQLNTTETKLKETKIDKKLKVLSIKCEKKDYDSCSDYGALIEIAGDKAGAMKLYQLSCNNGKSAKGCYNWAQLVKDTDTKLAFKLYRFSCQQSLMLACHMLGNIFYGKGNIDAARSNWEKSCSLNFYDSCHSLGGINEQLGNIKNAKHFYGLACNGGIADSCVNYARIFVVKNDIAGAKIYWEKACSLNDGQSCSALSKYYAKRQQLKLSITYLKKACENSWEESCRLILNFSS